MAPYELYFWNHSKKNNPTGKAKHKMKLKALHVVVKEKMKSRGIVGERRLDFN